MSRYLTGWRSNHPHVNSTTATDVHPSVTYMKQGKPSFCKYVQTMEENSLFDYGTNYHGVCTTAHDI